MPKIRNTARIDPLLILADAMGPGGASASIERMEAEGASEMASQSEQLPSDGSKDEAWAKMGVVFGDFVEGDKMFRKVTLPPGWKIERTDHSMWTKLVDGKGRKRASIFYKAAFYDRSAHITLSRRYSAGPDYSGEMGGRRGVARDGKVVLFATEELPASATYSEKRALGEAAEAWLTEHFPDWKSITAYWD